MSFLGIRPPRRVDAISYDRAIATPVDKHSRIFHAPVSACSIRIADFTGIERVRSVPRTALAR
jgi:hypothetical protein